MRVERRERAVHEHAGDGDPLALETLERWFAAAPTQPPEYRAMIEVART